MQKQRMKTEQAEVDEIYNGKLESENYRNDYELVDYDQIPDEQEYLEIQETEFD